MVTSVKTSFHWENVFVGGKDGRGLFIASGNELEEKVGSLDIHRKVADLVNDEHPVLGQDFELVGQTILKVSFFELLNELVAVDVVGGEPVLSSHQTKGGSQVGLSNTGRAKEDDIFSVLQEAHGSQFIDLALVDGGPPGLMTFSTNMLLGLGVMLSANEVPRIAQQFGLDTSVKVNMMSVVHSTTSAVNLTRSIFRK